MSHPLIKGICFNGIPAPHECVFNALRCDPSRCVHVYAWTHRDGTQRMKNTSIWGGYWANKDHFVPIGSYKRRIKTQHAHF